MSVKDHVLFGPHQGINSPMARDRLGVRVGGVISAEAGQSSLEKRRVRVVLYSHAVQSARNPCTHYNFPRAKEIPEVNRGTDSVLNLENLVIYAA